MDLSVKKSFTQDERFTGTIAATNLTRSEKRALVAEMLACKMIAPDFEAI